MALKWILVACMTTQAVAAAGAWDRIGPWNIFDGVDSKGNPTGEAGTLACAASPKSNPSLIYAGGQNNGVSSGIIKSMDGGMHWTRNSAGLWDTRILGVWLHPDDKSGNHVLAGTHSGIYESTDGAESWQFRNETKGVGGVISFREGTIGGKQYILANSGNAILTQPMSSPTDLWQSIKTPGGIASNHHLSVVIHDGETEVFTCIDGFNGELYYATLDSPSSATWSKPLTTTNGAVIHCANAAVDPNDRNHFLYSSGNDFHVYESKDGGKTTKRIGDQSTFFVMISSDGALFTATQAGAFTSPPTLSAVKTTWSPYVAIVHVRPSPYHPPGTKVISRGPHDYQRIIPDFRGDAIAFPSDQGLHIPDWTDRSNYQLISAVGDMSNAMALSALISPGKSGLASDRKIVVNMWDWDVTASWDNGKTWPSYPDKSPNTPYGCGEGGGGTAMGASGHVVMFHSSSYWASKDGGLNFTRGNFPPGGRHYGDMHYARQAGSRTEPAGTCFATIHAPSPYPPPPNERGARVELPPSSATVHDYPLPHPANTDGDASNVGGEAGYVYSFGVPTLVPGSVQDDSMQAPLVGGPAPAPTPVAHLMISHDFGYNWTYTPFPAKFQAGSVTVDPTNSKILFGLTSNCLAHSTDLGVSWSECSTGKGLTGSFKKLLIKSSTTMFLLRSGAVPLRTTDSGATWTELSKSAPLFKYGATFDGSLSWSGKTLVLSGSDNSAISRGEFGTAVWKSTNDGDDWTDETGDLVTISLGPGELQVQ
jgi:photosystem II stability/assembly factor-like uncharacterized protein